jgi:uncharacterized membrane protein
LTPAEQANRALWHFITLEIEYSNNLLPSPCHPGAGSRESFSLSAGETMKNTLAFLKTTLIGGLVLVIPLVITVLLVREAIRLAATVLRPVAEFLPVDRLGGVIVADIVAGLAILALCFLAGAVIGTGLGRFVSRHVEQIALRRVPGYSILKGVARGMVGLETESDLSVALARIEDAWMLAFLVERHANGLLTVFVPSAPTPAAGAVYYLTADRIKILNVPVSAAVACIVRLGVGSRELLQQAGVAASPFQQGANCYDI